MNKTSRSCFDRLAESGEFISDSVVITVPEKLLAFHQQGFQDRNRKALARALSSLSRRSTPSESSSSWFNSPSDA